MRHYGQYAGIADHAYSHAIPTRRKDTDELLHESVEVPPNQK